MTDYIGWQQRAACRDADPELFQDCECIGSNHREMEGAP